MPEFLTYDGVIAAQTPNVVPLFKSFLLSENFDIIIELGTYKGGLTLFLSDIFSGDIYTYDIKEFEFTNKLLSKENIHYNIKDIYKSPEIEELLASNKRVLLLVDGGVKIKAFNYFIKFLKPGDVIMAHDYFVSVKEFNSKDWDSREIMWSDIETSCKKYNVKEIWSEFLDVFWYCGQKFEEQK